MALIVLGALRRIKKLENLPTPWRPRDHTKGLIPLMLRQRGRTTFGFWYTDGHLGISLTVFAPCLGWLNPHGCIDHTASVTLCPTPKSSQLQISKLSTNQRSNDDQAQVGHGRTKSVAAMACLVTTVKIA